MKDKKSVRKKFRDLVFKRDKFTCQVCGEKKIESDHICDRSLMPYGGYVASNGITVCKNDCHIKVDLFHMSGGKEWAEGLHPKDLYIKIKSSFEKAKLDSELNLLD